MVTLYMEYSNTGALSLRSITVTITLAILMMSLDDASILKWYESIASLSVSQVMEIVALVRVKQSMESLFVCTSW